MLVTKDAGLTSASYAPGHPLDVRPGEIVEVDSVPLNFPGTSTISLSGTYALPTTHTLDVVIPDGCPAGAFSNTISLTVSN